MQIAIVVPSLSQGGAERVASMIAKYLVEHHHHVVLITIRSAVEDFFSLDKRVERVALGLSRTTKNPFGSIPFNLSVVMKLRNAVRHHGVDIVLSLVDRTNIRVLLATCFLRIPIIVSERNDLQCRRLGFFWRLLRRYTYRMASVVVVQTDGAAMQVRSMVKYPGNIVVIPNAVSLDLVNTSDLPKYATIQSENDIVRILAVGRLHEQKGFDLLIEAFGQVLLSVPNSELTIVGEGQERLNLIELCKAHAPSGKVHMPGAVRNIEQYYASAHIFVLSSRYEGFPNVLLEAMAFGVPSIAFDCPSGPGEIVSDEKNGIIVPAGRVDMLSSAIIRLAKDREFAHDLGVRAAHDIATRFSASNVMGLWEDLIKTQLSQERTNAERTDSFGAEM